MKPEQCACVIMLPHYKHKAAKFLGVLVLNANKITFYKNSSPSLASGSLGFYFMLSFYKNYTNISVLCPEPGIKTAR